MRSLRTDLTFAVLGAGLLLGALGLSQGCRPERPDQPGDGTAENGTDEGPKVVDETPAEPVVELRKQLQSEGYTVVTVHPGVFWTWCDGQVCGGPDLELQLGEMLQKTPGLKIAVLFADSAGTPWAGLVSMRERMDRLGVQYEMMFAGYAGLSPAVTADGTQAPPVPPAPPGGDGTGH